MLEKFIELLIKFCNNNDFKGYDPYDGLNSRIFQKLPVYRYKFVKQCWIQLFKHCPFNLRPLFLIEKGHNAKGLAIFAIGFLQFYEKTGQKKYRDEAIYVLDLLKKNHTAAEECCWGYNFPWQSRAFFVPANALNAICTVFAGQAFLRAYQCLQGNEYLQMAVSAADCLINKLNISRHDDGICFSYTQGDFSQVHNINLFVAAFLAEMAGIDNNGKFLELAGKAASFSLRCQNKDGSWYYGTATNQRWIDGFHTAYNLLSLKRYQAAVGDPKITEPLNKGISFYEKNFFLSDGTPKYYADRTYPVDIHSAALGIITSQVFGNFALAQKVWQWTIENMWDKDKGYFYFQKHKFYTIKTPYMRWSQAWMLYAISFLEKVNNAEEN